MSNHSEKELVLPSSFDAMTQIEPFVGELSTWASLDEEDHDRVMLAVSEAVNNAILHGNKEDSDKNVHLSANLNDERLAIYVRDEGDGFNPDKTPNPLDEKNLLNESGRGIYLMRQYADEVQFSKGGTKVTLIFYPKG